jgi:hypothetical protein
MQNTTGKTKTTTGGWIKFGLKGSADILGIRSPDGKAIAIEVKTGKGRLSPQQKIFKSIFEKYGGIYCEARSVDDALNAIKQ